MNSWTLPTHACLMCGTKLNMAANDHVERPSPGHLSVCMHCGAVAEYDASMALAPVDPASITIVEQQMIDAVRLKIRRRKELEAH